MGTFFWVLGGVTVLLGAVLVADKPTRHKVIRAIARRWERGRRKKTRSRARQHVRAQRMTAKSLEQVKPVNHRPHRPRLLATKCSAACRTSRKPAFDSKTGRLLCDCPCGGREHGMYRKGATPGAPRVTTKTPVGTSGTKKPKASTGAAPKPPTTAGPAKKASTWTPDDDFYVPTPNAKRGSGQTVSMRAPGPATPSLENYGQMVSHAHESKRCASGRFSIRTYTDRRTDPPKKKQTVVCGVCSKEL